LSLRALCVLLLGLALASGAARTVEARELDDLNRDVPVEITADEIVYEARRQVYVAEGNVRIVQGERRIDADWIVFNRLTRRGIAAGDVRVTDGETILEARFVEFDQDGHQGLVVSGRLDLGEGSFRMAGGELLKTGEDTYQAKDGSFTTCRCPEDEDRLPWVINADDADVEIGGYGKVTNATLDVLGVPTVWVPWAMFPVKTERASGVLLPQFKIGGGNGFEVALPLFWAARDNVNVVLTPRYMTERGFKPELLIETVFGRESSVNALGSYIRDQDPDTVTLVDRGTGALETRNQYDEDRWSAGLESDIDAPGGIRLRSDIKLVSDNEYLRDFDEFREYRRDRFLESTAFGFRHFGSDGSAAIVASALYRDDRQNPDIADRDKFLLQRAPTVELGWLPTRVPEVGGFAFEIAVDYTNFWRYKRADSVLDLSNPANGGIVGDNRYLDIGIAAIPGAIPVDQRAKFGVADGVFQEGEPLNDEGHRMILHPQIEHSFRLFDLVDVKPGVGWHQTLYKTKAQTHEERGLVTARLDVASELIGELDLPGLPPMQHLLEPRIGWAYVSKRSQSSNPLFVPATKVPQTRLRQLSMDNIVLDSADRIGTTNLVALGFGNRLYSGTGPDRELRAEVDLSVGYDFGGKDTFQFLIADGEIFGESGIRTKFNISYDLDRERIDEGLFELRFPLVRKLPLLRSSFLTLGYRYRQSVPLFFENFESSPQVDDIGGTFNRFKNSFSRINQITATTRLRFTENWALNYRTAYSFHRTILLSNAGSVEYTSACKCWAIQVQAENDRVRGFKGGVNFTFLGFGSDIANPFKGGALFDSGSL
jgi:lipopolysaccharide assembly outer membrane protein LptD (OstA)